MAYNKSQNKKKRFGNKTWDLHLISAYAAFSEFAANSLYFNEGTKG